MIAMRAFSLSIVPPLARRGTYAGHATLKKTVAAPSPTCIAMSNGSVSTFNMYATGIASNSSTRTKSAASR